MEEMEMPTPCQSCGDLFDLNDGKASEKWFPNTIICEECHDKEEEEIEEDDRWEEINLEISNGVFHLNEGDALARISEENMAAMKEFVAKISQIELDKMRQKAEKWDKLADNISKCYCNSEGEYDEENPEIEGADLLTIGEMAARAFGWLI